MTYVASGERHSDAPILRRRRPGVGQVRAWLVDAMPPPKWRWRIQLAFWVGALAIQIAIIHSLSSTLQATLSSEQINRLNKLVGVSDMPSYGGSHGPDGSKKSGDQGQGTRDRNGGQTGGKGRDTSGAKGGGLGRSRGGLVGDSETAKKNRERTGFDDPSHHPASDVNGNPNYYQKPNPTEMSTALPSYDDLPSPGQLLDSANLGLGIVGGGTGAMGAMAGAVTGQYDDTGRSPFGKAVDEATGSTPAQRDGWATGPGGYDQSNDPGNSSGMGGGRNGMDSFDTKLGSGESDDGGTNGAGTEIIAGQPVEFSDVRLQDRVGLLGEGQAYSDTVQMLLPQSTATATSRRRRASWEGLY